MARVGARVGEHRDGAMIPNVHLRTVAWKPGRPTGEELERGFPFDVPTVRALESIELTAPVTFFVGENGSGKSTLLEGIAIAAGLPAVGVSELAVDETLGLQRQLAGALRLGWMHRETRGFFLRAEDFFGFKQRLSAERMRMRAEITQLEDEYRAMDRAPDAVARATGPMRSSLAEMARRYGEDLDANSHGESFLKLFQSRLRPGGLYLLDEPEAALSPQSQLGLMAMMLDAVADGGQFVVATHAPILLGLPHAEILSFDETPPERVEFDELPHVRVTREFLNDRERYLRHMRG
jgi:predicted ATPase